MADSWADSCTCAHHAVANIGEEGRKAIDKVLKGYMNITDEQSEASAGRSLHVTRQGLANAIPSGMANQLGCSARFHGCVCHQSKCPTLHNLVATPAMRAAARREAERVAMWPRLERHPHLH